MANPLINAMASNNCYNVKNLYNLIKNNNNPLALLTQMSKTDTQAYNVLTALQQGSNPQQLFYTMCQQRGVDPNMILNQLNGFK